MKAGGGGGGDLLDFGSDVAPAQPPAALPPSTNVAWAAAPADPFGAASSSADPFGAAPTPALPPSTSDPWNTALTPVASTANPWGIAPTPPAAGPWDTTSAPAPVPPSADPWGAASAPNTALPSSSNPYAATPPQSQPTPVNPYASAPSANAYAYGGQSYGSSQYQPASSALVAPTQNGGTPQFAHPMSGQPSYTQSAPAPYSSQTPAPSGTWTAPPAISTSAPYDGQDVPSSVTPLAQQTPSSLGFGSPAPTFSGFSPTPVKQQPPVREQAPVYPSSGLGEFAASADSNPGSLFDQTFAKLANVESFSLTSKKEESTANPFASTSINDNRSLADMQKTKVRFKVISKGSCCHVLTDHIDLLALGSPFKRGNEILSAKFHGSFIAAK